MVQNATFTMAPGAMVTRRRTEATASNTVPTVPDSIASRAIATGSRTPCPRPTKRARSVSTVTVPSPTDRCPTQIAGSVGVRRRRVARMAPESAKYSVSTNNLAKAGWAMSVACATRASSA